jgi:hypothetical protein
MKDGTVSIFLSKTTITCKHCHSTNALCERPNTAAAAQAILAAPTDNRAAALQLLDVPWHSEVKIGFLSHGGTPESSKSWMTMTLVLKAMVTWGRPTLGNLHIRLLRTNDLTFLKKSTRSNMARV